VSAHAPRYDGLDPNDNYAAYNLPGSILHWVTHNTTDRTWIIKLDADMIIRRPLSVTQRLQAAEGVVAAGYYGYLVGVDNEMAPMFVPPHVAGMSQTRYASHHTDHHYAIPQYNTTLNIVQPLNITPRNMILARTAWCQSSPRWAAGRSSGRAFQAQLIQ
jgi:hypothetical protein